MARPFLTHPITDDSALGGSVIERSLKFNDDDTAYLSRTPSSAGDRKKWTFSAWIKRGNLGGSAGEQRIFGGNGNASHIYFPSNDEITWDLATGSGSVSGNLNTTQVFRDPSAWFHLVCALDTDESTADNRMRMYINGTEVTSFGSRTNPSSGYATNEINNNTLHTLGYRTSGQGSAGMEFDGYMAEINFIDGQQLTPSSFGYTDFQTGIWRPKRYEGTYGTNGFYLNFSDNSSTSTLGKDTSGNGNDFTANSFSVSAGVGNDSLGDTCTNNFATLSPLLTDTRSNASFSEGNLKVTTGSGAGNIGCSMGVTTGKWYAEFKCTAKSSVHFMIGVATIRGFDGERQTNESQNGGYGIAYLGGDSSPAGNKMNDGGGTSAYGAAYNTGDLIGVALDMDNNTVNFAKNNSYQGLLSISTTKGDVFTFCMGGGQGGATQTFEANFGANAFNYTPPSGFKALCSENLPPNIPSIVRPQKHFGVVTWSGNGTTSNRKISGLEFKPDLVWTKTRNHGYHHVWMDSVRGPNNRLNSDQNFAENNPNGGYLNSFDDGGFTWQYGGGSNNEWWNESGKNYIAWCWKGGGAAVSNSDGSITSSVSANTSAGFSIVGYTGNGTSGATVGHGLGVAPKFIITKQRSTAGHHWRTYHKSVGATRSLYLDLNNAQSGTDAGFMNNTEPTSTVFSLGNDTNLNENGQTHIAYCWAEVPGYSKFGSYTGNGNANGVYVDLGFRPAWIMIKSTSQTTNWNILTADIDGYNVVTKYLDANTSGAEGSYTYGDLLSNGFKARNVGGSYNQNGGTYVYMAFAEQPGSTAYATDTTAR